MNLANKQDARGYYLHEPTGEKKMAWIERELSRVCDRLKKDRLTILDIGCGDGHLTAFMASLGHRVVGIDTDTHAIVAAKARYAEDDVRFFVEDVATTQGIFDVVTAFEVLEHIPSVDRALDHVTTRLHPDGEFLVSVPNGWSFEEMVRRFVQHTGAGQRLKVAARRSGVLPKSDAQSSADSPHVRFWGVNRWRALLTVHDFEPLVIDNVSWITKQLYYLGLRRFVQPDRGIFRAFSLLDAAFVQILPRWCADGWLLSCRKRSWEL